MRIHCDSSTREACVFPEGMGAVIVPYPTPVTNNVGEYKAVISSVGIGLALYGGEPFAILTDSQLVVNQVQGHDVNGNLWRRCKPHLLPYRDLARELVEKYSIDLYWISREENWAGLYLDARK